MYSSGEKLVNLSTGMYIKSVFVSRYRRTKKDMPIPEKAIMLHGMEILRINEKVSRKYPFDFLTMYGVIIMSSNIF